MDHYQDNSKNQQRSKRTMGAKKERRGSQKLDISYLLNDTTSEERMDDIKRDPGLSRSSRPRAASTLHRDLASSSRGRADRSGRGYSNEGSSQLISCSQCRERFITLSELEDQYVLHITNSLNISIILVCHVAIINFSLLTIFDNTFYF